ncbi:hypothetical protein BD779DRAFT_843250 [Infundibulicybe gibba]|nr:hypothetical protein BD779DRAFT_843250 [Infundibulicybe gibba]
MTAATSSSPSNELLPLQHPNTPKRRLCSLYPQPSLTVWLGRVCLMLLQWVTQLCASSRREGRARSPLCSFCNLQAKARRLIQDSRGLPASAGAGCDMSFFEVSRIWLLDRWYIGLPSSCELYCSKLVSRQARSFPPHRILSLPKLTARPQNLPGFLPSVPKRRLHP